MTHAEIAANARRPYVDKIARDARTIANLTATLEAIAQASIGAWPDTLAHAMGEKARAAAGRRRQPSITTGWSPSLMLMHRRGAMGSWDLIDADDRITAVIGKRGERHPYTDRGDA